MTNAAVDDRAAPLAPGTTAPDFELRSTPDQTVSLSDFRGRPVILASRSWNTSASRPGTYSRTSDGSMMSAA